MLKKNRLIKTVATTYVQLRNRKIKFHLRIQGFFQQFWEKARGQNWEKLIDLTAKLGDINNIEHNKGSKIYPQNQAILDCIMSSIPLKHKCLSIILIWVIVSHK